jgi:O-antigen ligase
VGVAAENYFLQRALALGLPGMILYLLIAIRFFRNLRAPDGPPDAPPDRRWPRRALTIGGVAYYTQAMLYPTGGVSMGYTLWLLLALAEGMAADARDGGRS